MMALVAVGQLAAGTLQVFKFDVGNNNYAARTTAANSKLLQLAGGGTLVDKENFEGFTASNAPGNTYTSLNTGIGTFSTLAGNQVGSAKAANNRTVGFTILDSKTTPFSGRYNTSPGVNSKNWLDSNDNTKIGLTLNPPLNNLYFFMTDEGDQGGRVTVKTNQSNAADDVQLSNGNKNGTLYLLFWQGNAGEMIQTLEFSNTSRSDGFGLDRFGTIAPEPGFYGVLAAGFVGLAFAARRRKLSV